MNIYNSYNSYTVTSKHDNIFGNRHLLIHSTIAEAPGPFTLIQKLFDLIVKLSAQIFLSK